MEAGMLPGGAAPAAWSGKGDESAGGVTRTTSRTVLYVVGIAASASVVGVVVAVVLVIRRRSHRQSLSKTAPTTSRQDRQQQQQQQRQQESMPLTLTVSDAGIVLPSSRVARGPSVRGISGVLPVPDATSHWHTASVTHLRTQRLGGEKKHRLHKPEAPAVQMPVPLAVTVPMDNNSLSAFSASASRSTAATHNTGMYTSTDSTQV